MKSKGIIWLIIVIISAVGMFAYIKLSPAPNTELKATNLIAPEAIEPSVKETVNVALAAIKTKNAKNSSPSCQIVTRSCWRHTRRSFSREAISCQRTSRVLAKTRKAPWAASRSLSTRSPVEGITSST